MYCSKCGTSLSDEVVFCSDCGTRATNNSNVSADTSRNFEDVYQNEYSFKRYKGFGRGSYSSISTLVNFENKLLSIEQRRRLLVFFKKKLIDAKLNLSDIDTITIKRNMDPSDTMFGVIFLALGFLNPLLFIGAAVLLYSAYGQNITLQTKSGSFLIPTSAEPELDTMIQKILAANPNVSIQR